MALELPAHIAILKNSPVKTRDGPPNTWTQSIFSSIPPSPFLPPSLPHLKTNIMGIKEAEYPGRNMSRKNLNHFLLLNDFLLC